MHKNLSSNSYHLIINSLRYLCENNRTKSFSNVNIAFETRLAYTVTVMILILDNFSKVLSLFQESLTSGAYAATVPVPKSVFIHVTSSYCHQRLHIDNSSSKLPILVPGF